MLSNKYKDLSKNTILFTIANFGTKFISFIMVPLYTAVLSTNDYGVVDLVNTTVQLLIPVLTLNIQDAVLRFSLDKHYCKNTVITIGMRVIGIGSTILLVALLILKYLNIITIGNDYIIYLFLSFLLGVLNNNLNMYLKAKDKVKYITIFGVLNTLITCSMNVILLLFVKMGINGYMISLISGTLVADIGMFIFGKVYKDIEHGKANKLVVQAMLAYSTPLIINSISWWINNASDRYILSYYKGSSVNGIYSIAYKIPTILSTVQNIFYGAWSISAITQFDKNDEDGFIGNVYSAYSAMCIFACSIIMTFNVVLAKILYAKDFYQAWEYVPFLLVGTYFNGLGLFDGCIFTAVRNTKLISNTTLIGALTNTVLNFILIPQYGAIGAAFATMIGYFFTWLIRSITLRKIIIMKVNWKNQFLSLIIIFIQGFVGTLNESVLPQIPFMIIITLLQIKYLRKSAIKVKQMLRH